MIKKPNTKFDVSIIIPNFNGEKLLLKNLPQVIRSANYVKNNILEIIVVDDASTDRSVSVLKTKFPGVKVIKHRINRGFSSAVNTGARSAKGKLLALINNDVVPERNFLENVLPHFNDKKVFAVSLSEKGYGWARGKFEKGFIGHAPVKGKKAHNTFWVNGGSGVFRRSYWMELGGMDEKLLSPFYWEDVDLSYRALKRGWKLFWEPKARVVHHHASTIKKLKEGYRNRIQERNQLIFIWKNLTSPILFRKHLRGLSARLYKHPGYVRIVFMALLKTRTILKARRKERKQAKISDEAIFASL